MIQENFGKCWMPLHLVVKTRGFRPSSSSTSCIHEILSLSSIIRIYLPIVSDDIRILSPVHPRFLSSPPGGQTSRFSKIFQGLVASDDLPITSLLSYSIYSQVTYPRYRMVQNIPGLIFHIFPRFPYPGGQTSTFSKVLWLCSAGT